MRLLVTGASGVLGREVLLAAQAAGIAVRALTHRAGVHEPGSGTDEEAWVRGDLVTGEGLDGAVRGIDAIVHAASDPRNAEAVDVNGTGRLVDAAARAHVRHLVFVSIVGVDVIPYPYYEKKLAAEQIVAASGVPFSILRATQFHSFLDHMIAGAARVPWVLPLPTHFKVQPVEATEVAERVIRCVRDGPRARVTDFGGPEVLTIREAAQQWLEARHDRRWIVPVPLPGATAAAFRHGRNTAPQGDRGTLTWREWLMHMRDA
jgi:uncharacterized protein YbjT (DUF2867 family)